jgi:hypothetical protein
MFEEEAEEIVKRNVCGDCNKCQSHGYIGCDIYKYSKDSCLYGLRTGYNKANEKAKEIIREFMRISTVCDEDFEPDYSVLIDKAEEFLREEEGKNDKDRP